MIPPCQSSARELSRVRSLARDAPSISQLFGAVPKRQGSGNVPGVIRHERKALGQVSFKFKVVTFSARSGDCLIPGHPLGRPGRDAASLHAHATASWPLPGFVALMPGVSKTQRAQRFGAAHTAPTNQSCLNTILALKKKRKSATTVTRNTLPQGLYCRCNPPSA